MVSRRAHAVLVGALLLAACFPAEAVNPLALYPASPEGHAALLEGRLEMEGPCLYILDQNGEQWLAAFPSPGTQWNSEDRAVQVRNTVLSVGQTGGFGGGEATNAPTDLSWVQAPAASCNSSKIWLINSLVRGAENAIDRPGEEAR